MSDLPDPIQYAIPGFVVLMLAELWLVRRRDRREAARAPGGSDGRSRARGYAAGDTATSLMLGFISSIAGVLSAGAVFALALALWRHRLLDIPYAWWAWPLCFVLRRPGLLRLPPQRAPRALVLGQPRYPSQQSAL